MARILVICGGDNEERRVSLESGDAMTRGLAMAGHEAKKLDTAHPNATVSPEIPLLDGPVGVTPPEESLRSRLTLEGWSQLLATLAEEAPEAVFPILHGSWGEDGHFQALLEMLGLPYLGSGMSASALAMDKAATRELATDLGIPTAKGFLLDPEETLQDGVIDVFDQELEEVFAAKGARLVMKPCHGGSTVGLTIAASVNEAEEGVRRVRQLGDDVLVEEYVPGREVTVALVDGEALPVIEIVPKEGFYDYTNKYTKGQTDYLCPAEISPQTANRLREDAARLHDAIGCRHLARADFRLREDGSYALMEINTLPGMTGLSLVPMAAKAVGTEFHELMDRFVQMALRDA